MLNFTKKFLTANVKKPSAIEHLRKLNEKRFSLKTLRFNQRQIWSIVLFQVLMGFSWAANAQRDQITTQAGEVIRCRILDETPTRFVFAYIGKDGKVLRNEIFKNLVTDFKYNAFANDLVDSKGRLPKTENISAKTQEKPTAKEEKSTAKKVDLKKTDEKPTTNVEPKTVASNNVKSNELPQQKKTLPAKSEPVKINDSKKAPDEKVITPEKAPTKSPFPRKAPPRPNVEEQEKAKKTAEMQAEKPVAEEKIVETKTSDSPLAVQPAHNEFKNYLKFRVGAKIGYSSLLKKTALTDDYSKYQQGLESGLFWGVDAAYFPTDNLGFGVMYNNWQTSNKSTSIKYKSIITPSTTEVTGAISDKSSNKFLGPVFYYRKAIDFKTFVIVGLAPGYNLYNDNRIEGTSSLNIKGQQFGGAATLGVDFLLGNDIIGRDIILSLEGGYNYAKFDKFDYGKGAVTLPTPADLSHWNITIGLRFMRYPKYLRLTSY